MISVSWEFFKSYNSKYILSTMSRYTANFRLLNDKPKGGQNDTTKNLLEWKVTKK